MTTEITRTDDLVTIILRGRLDTPSTPEVEEVITPLLADDSIKRMAIDCSEMSYITSSGLRIFVTMQKHFLRIGGQLTLLHLNPMVRSVFDMTGFSSIFTIE